MEATTTRSRINEIKAVLTEAGYPGFHETDNELYRAISEDSTGRAIAIHITLTDEGTLAYKPSIGTETMTLAEIERRIPAIYKAGRA